jgi:transcriptional regulator with XRE-family HTH domain
MKDKLLVKFGKKLRAERELRDISQEELGRRAKVHRTYIGMIERAEKNITLKNMNKLAGALGLKINDLIDD